MANPAPSPFQRRKPNILERRAQARQRAAQRIARAPRHPPGIEQRLILLAAQLVGPINDRLRAHYMHKGRREDAPRPRTIARRELRKTITPLAQDLAKNTHAQVAQSLGASVADLPVDLSEQTYGFVDGVVSILEDYPIEATKRVAQAFTEWESVAEEDRTADALSTLLDDALDGELGSLQNSLRMLFGDTFAQMNKAVQVQSGVSGYYWKAHHDNRVRPEHEAMDNTDGDKPYSWDDPPLGPEESSNGEACHPGDDYNCRCVAIPAEASPAEDDASD
jgi:SPP1 gp7 family putative phage head morphogenesis protein